MKCVELKVTIKVPDDYECVYPFDTIVDANYRDDMEISTRQDLCSRITYKDTIRK